MFHKVLSMPLVLNSPRFWICLWFWMCHSFGYARVLLCHWLLMCQSCECARVTQGSDYAWIIHKNAWLCLIYLNMPEYVVICLNLPKSVWMVFVLHFPSGYITLHVVTYSSVYRKVEVIAWRNMKLFCLFKRQRGFDFSYSSWKYFICFLVQTKYFYK